MNAVLFFVVVLLALCASTAPLRASAAEDREPLESLARDAVNVTNATAEEVDYRRNNDSNVTADDVLMADNRIRVEVYTDDRCSQQTKAFNVNPQDQECVKLHCMGSGWFETCVYSKGAEIVCVGDGRVKARLFRDAQCSKNVYYPLSAHVDARSGDCIKILDVPFMEKKYVKVFCPK